MVLLSVIFWAFTLLLGIPVTCFFIQMVSACWPPEVTPKHRRATLQGKVSVLVPAHNESIHLLPTLRAVLSEKLEGLQVHLQVLVVADNCTDDTAEIARKEGVDVIERHNPELRGKGHALDFGIQYLKADPPQLVIVLDADCLPEKGALQALAETALATSRPVQALYLMKNTGKPALKAKIAEFAWLVKNHVRPRGMQRMGLPCQLTGSGMAFPWQLLQRVSLATSHIVEDMKLGMTLATLGYPPLFSERTIVSSTFPTHEEGVQSQRTRWEHGHLSMMWQEGVPKLFKGILNRDSALLFLALDVCIPPLALLVTGVWVWLGLAGLYWIGTGSQAAFMLSLLYFGMIAASVGLAWFRFGRATVSGQELLRAPLYVFSKLPVYFRFLFRRQAEWVRSKRDDETK